MTIEEYAEQNGFTKITASKHPKDGQIVTILGSSSKDFKTETVQWSINNSQHSYKWITADYNRGIMTTSLDYWKP